MNEFEYNGRKIQYIIKRSKIKNIYIQIRDGNVIVKAPIKIKEKYLNKLVNEKAKWIYTKLTEYNEKPKEEKIDTIKLQKLHEIVEEEIKKYSLLLNRQPKKIRIKELKYAWGSCSSNKNISINSKLANKNRKIIEYVVLHEMCHLVYMNHSKVFWKLIEQYMPEYKQYKKELRG